MPPTEPPAPPPVADVMIPDAMYLDEDNAPMAGSMTIAAGDSYTNNGVMFSCPAGGDACEVEVMDDGSVTSTGGAATAMLTDDAMVQVAQAKKDAADAAMAAALEMKDRIIGKDRALEAAANLPATGTANALDEDEILISRAPGAMARVRSTGYSVDADNPALPNGGWAGTHLTRSIAGATQHLFVYTDIEAPQKIQFYNWDGRDTTPSRYADTVTDAVTDGSAADASTTITPLALTVGTGGNFSAGTADPTKFPRPQSAEEGSDTQRYPTNARNAADTGDIVSIPGNFNGAGGRYECANSDAACTVTVAPNGTYSVTGTWTFTPELNAEAWLQDGGTAQFGANARQVGDFMSFGWWLQEPTAQTGVYTFRYYADGTAFTPSADGTNDLASGSATYNGRAAGKFVVQELDDTGVTGGEAGMFTAAATLTARFTGTGSAGNIEGAISGFQTDNANVDVSGWMVTLNRQTLAPTVDTSLLSSGSNDNPTSSGFDGATAVMGDQTAHGTWSSQFFGNPANDGGSADAYPLGVGGVFQADNEAASIAGAFGARR